VVHCRVTGTNTGKLMGKDATHKSFDITGMTMYQQLGIQAPAVAEG
jgi:hypothetical protein